MNFRLWALDCLALEPDLRFWNHFYKGNLSVDKARHLLCVTSGTIKFNCPNWKLHKHGLWPLSRRRQRAYLLSSRWYRGAGSEIFPDDGIIFKLSDSVVPCRCAGLAYCSAMECLAKCGTRVLVAVVLASAWLAPYQPWIRRPKPGVRTCKASGRHQRRSVKGQVPAGKYYRKQFCTYYH